jgi:hypothetical protein
MAKLAIPTVHMNGTSQKDLSEALCKAIEAVEAFDGAMQAVYPNGRDYYVQGAAAIKVAVDQHVARVKKIQQVRDELIGIALAVQDREITSEVEAAD